MTHINIGTPAFGDSNVPVNYNVNIKDFHAKMIDPELEDSDYLVKETWKDYPRLIHGLDLSFFPGMAVKTPETTYVNGFIMMRDYIMKHSVPQTDIVNVYGNAYAETLQTLLKKAFGDEVGDFCVYPGSFDDLRENFQKSDMYEELKGVYTAGTTLPEQIASIYFEQAIVPPTAPVVTNWLYCLLNPHNNCYRYDGIVGDDIGTVELPEEDFDAFMAQTNYQLIMNGFELTLRAINVGNNIVFLLDKMLTFKHVRSFKTFVELLRGLQVSESLGGYIAEDRNSYIKTAIFVLANLEAFMKNTKIEYVAQLWDAATHEVTELKTMLDATKKNVSVKEFHNDFSW